jgi:hypothetical protein
MSDLYAEEKKWLQLHRQPTQTISDRKEEKKLFWNPPAVPVPRVEEQKPAASVAPAVTSAPSVKGLRSPLEVYYRVFQEEQPRFSLHSLLCYWKYLKFTALQRYVQRQARMQYILDRWFLILTHPDQVAHDIREATLAHSHSEEKKSTSFSAIKSLELKKLSWNQSSTSSNLLSNEWEELQQRLYKPSRNCFLLMKVNTIDELLLTERYVNNFTSWIRTLFDKNVAPFVHTAIVSGTAGIGKKTLIRLVFHEYLWIDLNWISFSDISEEKQDQLFHSILESRKVDVNIHSQKKNPFQGWVIVIYDCDYLDASATHRLTKIWEEMGSIYKKGKEWKHQLLLLFVTTDTTSGLLGRIKGTKKVKHFPLYPKSSHEFRSFYRSVRFRMSQKNDEPLDTYTFPSQAEGHPWIYQLCDRRDVRALLNLLSFLWSTMDGVRTFHEQPTAGSGNRKLPLVVRERGMENKIAINCFDVVDYIVLRHTIPPPLQAIATQSRHSTTLLQQLLGVQSPSSSSSLPTQTRPNYNVYKFQSSRDIFMFPLMVIHNMIPYGLGFTSPKLYHRTLLSVDISNLSQSTLGIKYNRPNPQEVHSSLCQMIGKIADYQQYKRYVPEAEKYLLKDLLQVPLVNNNTSYQAFRSEYCRIRSETRTLREQLNRRKEGWQKNTISGNKECAIFLHSFDPMHLYQCFGASIDRWDGSQKVIKTVEPIIQKKEVKKRKTMTTPPDSKKKGTSQVPNTGPTKTKTTKPRKVSTSSSNKGTKKRKIVQTKEPPPTEEEKRTKKKRGKAKPISKINDYFKVLGQI